MDNFKFLKKSLNYFLNKGKKSRIETKTRFFFKNSLTKVRKKNLIKKESLCIEKIKPYIRLLVRKRGKRSIYKVGTLRKDKREKKAFLWVSKVLRESKSEYFLNIWEKEVLSIAKGKGAAVTKCNMLHKTGLQFAPYKWKKKYKSRKTSRKAFIKINNFKFFTENWKNDGEKYVLKTKILKAIEAEKEWQKKHERLCLKNNLQ